ncbi:TPA: hypothetical protein DIC38_01375 [Candidatus Nomurabacteria bacterium]|nr:MAG: hypothetical protein O210_OD1C00001G0455 [Parcubacteria bacterium RAAC4_OD1_1]HCY26317.1 hypothetical protein [Candidatus Nomurabacteria bacterium]
MKIYKEKIKIIKGFTLIETMVAVFILSLSVVGIVGMISSSYFSAVYSKNEITATYLMQEAVDYVRNDRDTSVILGGQDWNSFISKYNSCSTVDGCYLNILDNSIYSCSSDPDESFGEIVCPRFTLDEGSIPYYNYNSLPGNSNFKRKIVIEGNSSNPNQIDMYVTVEWKNGNLVRSRSLEYSILNWTN